ncbi:hypothetical protein [Hymenobacter terrenus]|uniref:hypothetical protein n=1 Tax=Hymenobacter terrenus TaxID=1629124 RepID=UPI0006197B56|nr:hypothetical protein [Hymenobacter terrenus]
MRQLDTTYHMSVSFDYNNIFDDYESFDLDNVLKQIPSKKSLEVIGHFLAQMHTKERNINVQFEMLQIWGNRLPNDVKNRVIIEISNIMSQKPANSMQTSDFNFINNISSLKLIQHIFKNYNSLDQEELTAKQELLLFKSYLYCSKQWTDEQANSVKGVKPNSELDFAKFIIQFQMPYAELIEFKDFRLQFIKAVYFFKFCEQDPLFNSYLSIFLKEINLPNWHQYLINILSSYVRKFEPLRIPSIMAIGEEYADMISWLEELCIDADKYSPKPDFTELRERPIFKINDTEFLFLNLNFLIDKIYQGIQFDFAKALVKAKAHYKGKPIKNYPDFKSIFGSEFSENNLFYKIMNYSFEKSKYFRMSGEDMKTILGQGEPDYYMRSKNKVYLFEYKDKLISAESKINTTIERKIDEIYKKFVIDDKSHKTGVGQLIESIKEIRKGNFTNKIDKQLNKNCIIYPVIVYTDFSLVVPGINIILNTEFKTQLKHAGFENDTNIKNLTLLSLDGLIKFQDLFRDGRLKLNNCLNNYFEAISNPNILQRIISFDTFIHNKTSKITYDSPKMLMEEIIKMVPPELE